MHITAYLEYRCFLRIISIPPLSSQLMITNEESVVNIFLYSLPYIHKSYFSLNFMTQAINTGRVKKIGV